MTRILIVDDDDAFRESLAETLTDLGHETIEASNGHDALRIFATDAPLDCAFLDFRMTDMSGIDVLERLREMPSRSTLPVVVLTAFATSDNTIHAMRLGAFEHLTKPVGRDAIAALLANIDESSEPDPRGDAPRIEEDSGEPRLIGASDALREVQKQIGRAAASDSTVLITGETGTGKEVAARVLHDASKRHGGPFVAINCAAIPAELLESELFGHTKGAFTGAVAERAGRFVEARGGTLFLDEIGDMPLSMQAKLLRAIQERAVMPLGANRPVDIDVRIVAATHRDLQAEVVARTFREDLFYRLNVIPVHLPPLRDRPVDILPLARRFLALAVSAGSAARTLSAGAERQLLGHTWPGNVRELKNAMERVQALARGALVTEDDLAFLDASAVPAQAVALHDALLDLPLPEAVERLERAAIERALVASSGNRAEAARRLGISRQSLYTKLAAYGLG
ncbi:two component, sigma54 specific, Fis family transcriptional regulator [Caballeronia arationis]|jgi:DNA-binding NtrC family response regulator|uniref:Two component, sigma54 specific, transcriptional regulator, Fis family n=1 Tax=Caballeronia arationis TaxID=1777142 RepID=A0A7Z7I364_9BURK|nr:sigma-54 dependent transcriptional regulator [Caballeronia arationis]SAL05053.1 two component, sigma54 specific, Fis family transcriptional regulator [Caballeronia arationis]SOE55054.1 two component, sigma54 specific, transcriptional regulator, Fis family [Caballeronia arationis]